MLCDNVRFNEIRLYLTFLYYRLEVPDPTQSIQIWLKSQKGPIEVYLCPEETSTGNNSDSTLTCSSSEDESRSSFTVSDDSRSCDDFKCKLKCCLKGFKLALVQSPGTSISDESPEPFTLES